MITFSQEQLNNYLAHDWILKLITEKETIGEETIRTNEWIKDMDNKRLIYSEVYGDLLREKSGKKVLDVGGGYNSLTKVLAENCNYTLLDFLAHGGETYIGENYKKYNINWINSDWYTKEFENDYYDIVVANDIFPDVDQRMELFIDKMLPICKELRLVLTYYNEPKFYTAKRVDDKEILTFLSWDGEITSLKLMKYKNRLMNTRNEEIEFMKLNRSSIFRNGRQVSYIVLKGDL